MKNYALLQSAEYKTIRELIEVSCKRYGEMTAYSYRKNPRDKNSVKISFSKLCFDVRSLGTELISRGFSGKHVAVTGKMSYLWIVCYLSLMSSGAVIVPLDSEWDAEDLANTVGFAECEYIFCDRELFQKSEVITKTVPEIKRFWLDMSEGEENISEFLFAGSEKLANGDTSYFDKKHDPDSLCEIVFTSGTTGKGKGVMLTQKALLSDIANGLKYIEVTKKSIAVLPLHHTFGSTVNILGHICEGTELYLSMGVRYVLKELKLEKPGHLVLVPLYLETFYRKILANAKEKGKDKLLFRMMKVSNALRKIGIDKRRLFFKDVLDAFGGNVSMVITGGAPISTEIAEAFETWGIDIINGYGITECSPLISVNRNKARIKGSVGFVLPCDEVKIADPDDDGEGEIRVKGPNVMLGYYRDKEATNAVFDEEGYFRTGDIGKIDDDGALYITGRMKNLIILSNGKNVYPEEIESVFSSVPGVLDIVVYEGQSRRGISYNAVVAEVFPDAEYLKNNGIEDIKA
ncbi:MAG: AMP-binding protein, partial [Eubacteriales bacterium]